jgi:hypothetical protein
MEELKKGTEPKLTDIEVLDELDFDVRDFIAVAADKKFSWKAPIEEKEEKTTDANGTEIVKKYVEIKGHKYYRDVEEGLGYKFNKDNDIYI